MKRSLILAAAFSLALAPAAWAQQSGSSDHAPGTTSGPAAPGGAPENGGDSHSVTGNASSAGGHVGVEGSTGTQSGKMPRTGTDGATSK